MFSNLKSGNTYKKVLNILLDILIFLFGIILIISFYNVIQVKILGNNYSSFFGYTMFEVQTDSMVNTDKQKQNSGTDDWRVDDIKAGDWIIVKEFSNYEVKDVITFIQEDKTVTHRIVEKYNDTYVTQGDANNTKDDPISTTEVVGKVVNKLSYFGFIKSTIFNPFVLGALIITIYLIKLNYKKEGEKKVFKIFGKIKNTIKKKLFDDEFNEKPLFLEEKTPKSFENISQPTFADYEERVERYANDEDYEDDEDVENVKFEDNQPIINRNKPTEEDLSKTMFFRIISVDDDGNSELKFDEPEKEVEKPVTETKEEIKTPEEEVKPEPVVATEPEETEETSEEDEDSKSILEMIFEKPENKKSKNIIAKAMVVKEEELNKLVDTILGECKLQVNEASIKKSLIKSYVESKYFNIFSERVANIELKKIDPKVTKFTQNYKLDVITESNGFTKNHKQRYRKVINRIAYALEEDSIKLSKKYNGNDKQYDNKLNKYSALMILIAKLEYLVDLPLDMKNKKMLYSKEVIKFIDDYKLDNIDLDDIVKELIHTQKGYRTALRYFIDKLNTEVFELIYSGLKSDKNKILLNLKHNIVFSQVYNDMIVEKAYQEGIIAEDKLNVLLTLLQARLVSDMLTGDFSNEYLITIPNSLVAKETKFERLFKQNNEEYAKKNIIYLVEYDQFMKRSDNIKMLRKNGFRIGMLVNNNTKFISKNKISIALAECICLDKNTKSVADIERSIFDNFKSKVIKEDFMSKLDIIEEER